MAKHADDSGLNDNQKKFCERYIYDYNGTKSYREAYPNCTTDKTAGVEAHKLLKNPKVEAYIKELKADLEKVSGVSKLRIIEEYKKMAFTDITDLHNSWVSLKEFKGLTKAQRASIASIETQTKMIRGENGKMEPFEFVKIRLHNKERALEGLRKMLGHDEVTGLDGQLTVKIVRE